MAAPSSPVAHGHLQANGVSPAMRQGRSRSPQVGQRRAGHRASSPLADARLFPMPAFVKISGNAVLDALHEAQVQHPLKDVWEPSLRLPTRLIEYVSAVCVDTEPEVRQEAILLLKRYGWYLWSKNHVASSGIGRMRPAPQVVALTCVHLASKHWRQQGPRSEGGTGSISEQQLHFLSRNSYTRQEFIEAEAAVMLAIGCTVHWEGSLLAEWVGALLILAAPLLREPDDLDVVRAVVTHVSDVLSFHDNLMAAHLPSQLAAAALHASVMLCTKQFHRYAFTLRISHLCRISEELMVQLSEQILTAAVGSKRAELILEGSGVSAEDSLPEDDGPEERREVAPPRGSLKGSLPIKQRR
eukprot:TRINITY_DN50320_c0_g1_i1.p1 TRINITY_DN50320_c0_g1~~TRINITY_DN50320_c0_g1_i1.p1  ORF type:complete len:364 (-),score=46.30 TRINITY_DN50320_c0_g1_i1:68-1135(-)